MIEVTLRVHPYHKDLTQIWIDEHFYREFNVKYLKKFSLTGNYQDQASWELLFDEWERKAIKLTILQKLNYKSYFTTEIEKFLKEAGFAEFKGKEVIRECENLHLFSDDEQIKSLIYKAIQNRKGPYWIKQALKLKGVLTKVENLIEELYPREKRLEVIHHFLTKSKKAPHLQLAALQRHGFSFEEIREAKRMVF